MRDKQVLDALSLQRDKRILDALFPEDTMTDLCPQCGAGKVKEGPGWIEFALPRGYPFETPCEECKRRAYERAFEMGRKFGIARDEAVMQAMMAAVCGPEDDADEPVIVEK